MQETTLTQFFFRNLVMDDDSFENVSVISSNNNVELVTALIEKKHHQLITRFLCRQSMNEDTDLIYEWKSFQDQNHEAISLLMWFHYDCSTSSFSVKVHASAFFMCTNENSISSQQATKSYNSHKPSP